MKVILSVPDEGYFERTDEGYFERTCWRLFWAYLMLTKLDIYVFIACFLMFALVDFLLAKPDY